MRTRLVPLAVIALVSVGALTGCTGSGASSAGGGGSENYSLRDEGGAGQAGGGASGTVADRAAAVPADRSVVVIGDLSLVADDPIRVADRIEAIVERAGGLVADSSEDPRGRASASLTLRIPSAGFRTTLAEIQRQGDVRALSIRSSDVTAQVTDYAVRIENLRTSIDRLQDLLAEADTSRALVDIETALTDRQERLETLLAQQRALVDQVSLATLAVSVLEPSAAPAQAPNDFVGGVVAGTAGLVRTAVALAIGAGVLLPWAAVLAVLGGLAMLIVRRTRRARTTSA